MNLTFEMKGFDKELLKSVIEGLREKGLSFEEEWQKSGLRGFKPSDPENADSLNLKINNFAFLTAFTGNISVNETKLSEQEKITVLRFMKEKFKINPPSFVLPVILSGVHFLILLIIILIGLAGDTLFLVIGGGSLIGILIGISFIAYSFNQKSDSLYKVGAIFLIIGMFLSIPSSLLQVPLIKALDKKDSFERLKQI